MRLRAILRRTVSWAILSCSLIVPGLATAETSLPKIVSLDHCSDQYALALADRSQIAALSNRAQEDYSFFADRAKGLPQISGTLEEILYINPDMVVRYWGGKKRMLSEIEQADIQVVSAKTGLSMDDMLDNVDVFARVFDQESRGAVFRKTYEDRIARLAAVKNNGIRALYMSPSGTSAGEGTFADEILNLAGLTNVIAGMGLSKWPMLPLEAMVLDPPDVIIGAFFDSTSIHRSDWGILRHSRVQKMFEDIPIIYVPGRLLSCRTFTFIDAAEFVIDELHKIFPEEISDRGQP